MNTPPRPIGSKIESLPVEQVERVGVNVGAVIEGVLNGVCALSALQMGRLSLRANCEAEWTRLATLEVMEGFRKSRIHGR